jgi:hypothetical protein
VGCLGLKPIVDRLERDLKGQAQFIRLEFSSGTGREATRAFEVELVPTILVFDTQGTVRYKAYGLQTDWKRVREEVRSAAG